jgi:hypothetical protein
MTMVELLLCQQVSLSRGWGPKEVPNGPVKAQKHPSQGTFFYLFAPRVRPQDWADKVGDQEHAI